MSRPGPGSRRPNRDRAASAASAVTGPELDARRAERLRAVEILKAGRTPLQLVAVAEEAERVADAALAEARVRTPPRAESACREGCTWCCYQTVGTAAPEVLRIAAYLRQTLSPEDLQATLARVEARDERRQGVRPDRRSRFHEPCALLDNGRCVAYPVRPLTCRGFNSEDASACEQSLQPGSRVAVPAYGPQQRLYTLVLDGMRAALEESRLEGELLELTAALRTALTQPDAAARWTGGASVFAAARLA